MSVSCRFFQRRLLLSRSLKQITLLPGSSPVAMYQTIRAQALVAEFTDDPLLPDILRARIDCDGAVDNGTPLYDDDGDGHSEALGDCDDDDADAFPNADEYCNDADDDCDGVVDDDCIALTQVPLQQTDVIASPTSVEGQGTAQVSMVVVDDGDLSWSWSADGGSFADPTAEAATWNAPAEPGVFTITGRALDADNNEVWAFGEVTVLPDGALDGILIATEGEGCSTAPVGGLWLLLLAVRRRR